MAVFDATTLTIVPSSYLYGDGAVIEVTAEITLPEGQLFQSVSLEGTYQFGGGAGVIEYVPGSFVLLAPDDVPYEVLTGGRFVFDARVNFSGSAPFSSPCRMRFSIRVLPSPPPEIDLLFTAYCQVVGADGTVYPSVATSVLPLSAQMAVSLTKTATPAQVRPGGRLDYHFLIANVGRYALNRIVLTDRLPMLFRVLSVQYQIADGPIQSTDFAVDPATNLLTVPAPTGAGFSLTAGKALTILVAGIIVG